MPLSASTRRLVSILLAGGSISAPMASRAKSARVYPKTGESARVRLATLDPAMAEGALDTERVGRDVFWVLAKPTEED